MKKFLLLSAMALALATPITHAFTPKQFVDKGKVWVAKKQTPGLATNSQNIPYYMESEVQLRTAGTNDVYLIIDDFGDVNSIPDITGDQIILSINNSQVTFAQNVQTTLWIQTGTMSNGYPGCKQIKAVQLKKSGNTSWFLIKIDNAGNMLTETLTGTASTITDSETGQEAYRIEFGPYLVMKSTLASGTHYRDNTRSTGGYYPIPSTNVNNFYTDGGRIYQTYTANATVNDTQYSLDNNLNKTGKTSRTYTANVKKAGNTKIKVENFARLGHPFTFSMSGNSVSATYSDYAFNFDSNTMELTMPATDVVALYSGAWLPYRLAKNYNSSNRTYSPITGRVDSENQYHQGQTKWLNQLSNKTYLKKTKLLIDDYMALYINYNNSTPNTYRGYYEGTEISLDEDMEYTHDLTIKKEAYGYGQIDNNNPDKYIYLNLKLQDYVNSYYVDRYELYIVPVDFTTNPNYNSNNYKHEDNGHVNGTRIDLPEYFTYFPNYPETNALRTMAAEDEANPFEGNVYNVLIPENDLVAKDESGTGNYAVYVKAYYTPESGLEPSFHALTTLDGITTGVEDIVSDGADMEDAPAVYYNLNGVQVDGENLTPGIYVRRQGNTATKIIVK